jgi:hypothetical protein
MLSFQFGFRYSQLLRQIIFFIASLTFLSVSKLQAQAVDKPSKRCSNALGGLESNGVSVGTALSGNGKWLAFASNGTDLLPSSPPMNTFGYFQIYVCNTSTQAIVPISLDNAGFFGNTGNSVQPSISADGRYIVYASMSSIALPGDFGGDDLNNFWDIYLRDRDVDGNGIYDEPFTSLTKRVSLKPNGTEVFGLGLFGGKEPAISGNGRYVVFQSNGPGITVDKINTNNTANDDIVRQDLWTGPSSNTLVGRHYAHNNPNLGGFIGVGYQRRASISYDGQQVVFLANPTAFSFLVPRWVFGGYDLTGLSVFQEFVVRRNFNDPFIFYDVIAHAEGIGATGGWPFATNKTPYYDGGTSGQNNYRFKSAKISGDGNSVVFESLMAKYFIADNAPNYLSHVYLRKNLNNCARYSYLSPPPGQPAYPRCYHGQAPLIRVSQTQTGQMGNGGSYQPTIGMTNQRLAFSSMATNLANPGPGAGAPFQLILAEMTTAFVKKFKMISAYPNGGQGDGHNGWFPFSDTAGWVGPTYDFAYTNGISLNQNLVATRNVVAFSSTSANLGLFPDTLQVNGGKLDALYFYWD